MVCELCENILNSHELIKQRGRKGEKQRQQEYLALVHEQEHGGDVKLRKDV